MNNQMPSNPSISRTGLFQQDTSGVDLANGSRRMTMFEQWQAHLKNCARCVQRRQEGKHECGRGEYIRREAETETGHSLTAPVMHPAVRHRIRDFFFKPRTAA